MDSTFTVSRVRRQCAECGNIANESDCSCGENTAVRGGLHRERGLRNHAGSVMLTAHGAAPRAVLSEVCG